MMFVAVAVSLEIKLFEVLCDSNLVLRKKEEKRTIIVNSEQTPCWYTNVENANSKKSDSLHHTTTRIITPAENNIIHIVLVNQTSSKPSLTKALRCMFRGLYYYSSTSTCSFGNLSSTSRPAPTD